MQTSSDGQMASGDSKIAALDLAITYCGGVDERSGGITPAAGVLSIADQFRAWLDKNGDVDDAPTG